MELNSRLLNSSHNKLWATRLITAALLTVLFCGCTKVYYKEFLIPGTHIMSVSSLDFSDIEIRFSIKALPDKRGGRITTDMYKIHYTIRGNDQDLEVKKALFDSFKMERFILENKDEKFYAENIHSALNKKYTEPSNYYIKFNYDELRIPDEIDTLFLSLSCSYNNILGDTIKVDTSGVMLIKNDSHYTVPLGPLLD